MALLFEQGLVSAYAYPKSKSNLYWLTEMKVKKSGTWFEYETVIAVKSFLFVPEPLSSFLKNHTELYVEDGVIYEMPHCMIYLANKTKRIEWFKTREELDEFMKTLEEKFSHIKI